MGERENEGKIGRIVVERSLYHTVGLRVHCAGSLRPEPDPEAIPLLKERGMAIIDSYWAEVRKFARALVLALCSQIIYCDPRHKLKSNHMSIEKRSLGARLCNLV